MTDQTQIVNWPKVKLLDKLDFRTTVGLLIIFAFILILVLVVFVKLPTEQVSLAIVSTLLGQLSMKFGTVVDYTFGSSDGSKKKDDALIVNATEGK